MPDFEQRRAAGDASHAAGLLAQCIGIGGKAGEGMHAAATMHRERNIQLTWQCCDQHICQLACRFPGGRAAPRHIDRQHKARAPDLRDYDRLRQQVTAAAPEAGLCRYPSAQVPLPCQPIPAERL